MKKKILQVMFLIFALVCNIFSASAQYETADGYVPGNRTISTLEKNILFNATSRYKVTISGQGAQSIPASALFDGSMSVNYTNGVAINQANPLVVLIEGLPLVHTQVGAWAGFSTRYWPAKRFTIEGYNQYSNANTWVTLASVDNNTLPQYIVPLRDLGGAYTKLRFTFYEGDATSYPVVGQIGLSELFFIHTEAAQAYDGLLVKYDSNSNVAIGNTPTPSGYKLSVDGKLIAEEVTVKMSESWPDYVFDKHYQLMPLDELESYLATNGHLPDMPSAEEVKRNGVNTSEAITNLTKKVEELTLYVLELKKENEALKAAIEKK